MECREKCKKPGAVFPVRDGFHYALPSGLKDGTLVKLLRFERGYWVVEVNGKQFTVFTTRIDSGFEYKLEGKWLSATDPRVIARKEAETLVNSPAYSCVHLGCVNPPLP
jgi:hypothetical protein